MKGVAEGVAVGYDGGYFGLCCLRVPTPVNLAFRVRSTQRGSEKRCKEEEGCREKEGQKQEKELGAEVRRKKERYEEGRDTLGTI